MIRKKIIFFVSLIILIICGLISFVVYSRISSSLVDLKQKEIIKLNTAQSRELSQIFSKSQQFIKLIAIRTRVVDYLDKPTQAGKQELIGIFDEYPKLYPDYLAIYLIDTTGNTIISTDRSFIGENYGFRDYFKEALKGSSFTEALIGSTSNHFGYYFSHPVINKDGKVTGVVVGKLDQKVINNVLAEDQAVRDSYLMLTDFQGVVLYSQKPERIFKTIGKLSEKDRKEIIGKNKFADNSIIPLQYDSIQEKIRTYTKSILTNFFDKADDEEEIVGLVKIGNYPYFLVTEIEVSELKEFAFEIAIILAILVLIGAVLALIIVSIIISRFLQPFNQFQNFSKSISQGDLNVRLDIKSKDEFGQLADSFNKMADNLKESKLNIEEKVNERTSELNKINKLMVGRELNMIELKKRIKELENK